MATIDIGIYSLGYAFLLLLIPLFLSHIYGLDMARPLLYSVFRMCLQLVFIGLFLKYIFNINSAILNLLWLIAMIVVAVFSAIKRSSFKLSKLVFPTFVSFFVATFIVLLWINVFVIRLDYVFDARYLIVLGGMLLGNSLRGNVVGVSSFYQDIRQNYKRYLYLLSCGATVFEATLPFLRKSVNLALQPTLASMATMGIVALPGMMTGVILGGASPLVAIKYQIMIMIAILVSTIFSVLSTIVMTRYICFFPSGTLAFDIFIDR